MTQRSARSVFEFNVTASYTHSVSSALRAALSPFLDAALPVGRTPSQRLRVLLRICSDCTTPQLCATGSRVGGSGCFNLALGPSHLRHSARVLTTSHVPTHNACATSHSGLSRSRRVIRIASYFTFLDAALPVGRTPSQRLCVLLRICSDHSGAT